MAGRNKKPAFSLQKLSKMIKLNRNISNTADQMIDKLQSDIYGSIPSKDVDSLDTEFELLVNNEIKAMNDRTDGDISSFIEKLAKETVRREGEYVSAIEAIFRSSENQAQSLISEAYRNKLIKRADIHEVASQLSELNEAVNVTRDSIIASDVVDGHMCRTLKFDYIADDDSKNYQSIVEKMEEHFKLQTKTKDFIIPKTLEQGEYYAYIVPYSRLFDDFNKLKQRGIFGRDGYVGESTTDFNQAYTTVLESTLGDSYDKTGKNHRAIDKLTTTMFESVESEIDISHVKDNRDVKGCVKSEFESILSHIEVCNDPLSIAFLEQGDSVFEYGKYLEEAAAESHHMPSLKNAPKTDPFSRINNIDDGTYATSTADGNKKKSEECEFDETKDCYFKLIDSMHLFPVKIMTKVIGYYYVQEEILNVASDSNYFLTLDSERQHNAVDEIVSRIVKAFDKKFLENNSQFKDLIAEAIQFYNLHERRIKFQYIPAEYIVPFVVNEDEDGNGTSILEPALFHAKLYLLLLLFKMMSIVSNSNDTKVHYIKSSGIDKNIANLIQDIARNMQSRQINLTDLFSYTTLVNKVGNGSQLFIPLGRQNEKGIETEVLAGQEVQINNELMELLRNSYISETGVPAVIMNNINEAEFAKTLELGNTRFQQRVVSLQLSFNPALTQMYRLLMKYTTNIPENVIDNFKFEFQSPKNAAQATSNEQIGNFDSLYQLAVSLFFSQGEVEDEGGGSTALVREFKKLLAQDRLQFLNIPRLEELVKEARIRAGEEELKPKDEESSEDDEGNNNQPQQQ